MSTTPQISVAIDGGKKLSGRIVVNASKNGAVALLAASLLNKKTTTLYDVPRIEEVHRLVETLESMGVAISWKKNVMRITPPPQIDLTHINTEAARMTRSILLFIGPLIHERAKFSIPLAGGCKLGSRTIRPHLYALEQLGITITTGSGAWVVSRRGPLRKNQTIIMYESSDTATANTLLAAARIPGKTTIKYASANYQVQELCFFLAALGVRIDGIGTTTLVVHGKKSLSKNALHHLSEDPTDAMFFITAAIMTRSRITIARCPIDFLEKELLVLEKMGLRFKILKRYLAKNSRTHLADIRILPSELRAAEDKIHAQPYPGLNMDNLPFFAVIATQATGTTLIHDWVYEKRAVYYTELDKLGAETMLADPHRIYISGPTKLTCAELVCPPALRPATIILIAMLAAEGTSVLRNIYSINRGYEDLVTKLNTLGARVHILP